MKSHFNQFPKWMRWIAQDADGQWWGYEHEPHLADSSWYENEVGLFEKIVAQEAPVHWTKSLKKIKL